MKHPTKSFAVCDKAGNQFKQDDSMVLMGSVECEMGESQDGKKSKPQVFIVSENDKIRARDVSCDKGIKVYA